MVHEIILSSLIVVFMLFLSLFIKRYIKDELKIIKPFCKLINIVILVILAVFLLLELNNPYLLIFVIVGFILQHFIKTRFFVIPLSVIAASFISNVYLFGFSSVLSFYYLLFGYSTDLNKKDLILVIVLHLATFISMVFGRYYTILIALIIGSFIKLITKDFKELKKEKWHSI